MPLSRSGGQRQDANALTATSEALDDFFDRFDIPAEDENVIVYAGSADRLLDTLIRQRQS
ncbi:hypothetical protein [Streptomyces kebangsaanensis]|uniref:hypothetical protein n=1 Tax=Streptomyces kebangsaanensis TaxID=864058 RepID=UPI000B30F617|nr:hypothetical protein [Streptomyces kebangsaanensis]